MQRLTIALTVLALLAVSGCDEEEPDTGPDPIRAIKHTTLGMSDPRV